MTEEITVQSELIKFVFPRDEGTPSLCCKLDVGFAKRSMDKMLDACEDDSDYFDQLSLWLTERCGSKTDEPVTIGEAESVHFHVHARYEEHKKKLPGIFASQSSTDSTRGPSTTSKEPGFLKDFKEQVQSENSENAASAAN